MRTPFRWPSRGMLHKGREGGGGGGYFYFLSVFLLPPNPTFATLEMRSNLGWVAISQSLVEPLLGTKLQPAWWCVPSNSPSSDCDSPQSTSRFSSGEWKLEGEVVSKAKIFFKVKLVITAEVSPMTFCKYKFYFCHLKMMSWRHRNVVLNLSIIIFILKCFSKFNLIRM